MVIQNGQVTFQFKMKEDSEWQTFCEPLKDFKKVDLTDTETLSEEIHEIIYAMDDRAYEDRDNLQYSVNDFWDNIVLVCHEALYQRKFEEEYLLFDDF